MVHLWGPDSFGLNEWGVPIVLVFEETRNNKEYMINHGKWGTPGLFSSERKTDILQGS